MSDYLPTPSNFLDGDCPLILLRIYLLLFFFFLFSLLLFCVFFNSHILFFSFFIVAEMLNGSNWMCQTDFRSNSTTVSTPTSCNAEKPGTVVTTADGQDLGAVRLLVFLYLQWCRLNPKGYCNAKPKYLVNL